MISAVKGQFVRSSPTSRNQSSDGGECAALADTETQRWKLHPLCEIWSNTTHRHRHIGTETQRNTDIELETHRRRHRDSEPHDCRHKDTNTEMETASFVFFLLCQTWSNTTHRRIKLAPCNTGPVCKKIFFRFIHNQQLSCRVGESVLLLILC